MKTPHRVDHAGEQQHGDCTDQLVDEQGREVARGLVNYSAAEARQIKGRPSSEIEPILGYVDDEELIHRDNLVLV